MGRVVELPNKLDMNLCCGTHLSSLQELQVIKLLGLDKGKKGKVLLNFICGNRVLKWMNFAFNHQTSLTSVLKGGPKEHAEKASIVVQNMKNAERGLRTALRDLAVIEAETFKHSTDPIDLHRKDGSYEYINIISQSFNENTLAILTTGDEKAKNPSIMFILHSKHLESVAVQQQLNELLNGKGSCKNFRMQGKCTSLKKRKQVLEILRNGLE